MYPLRRLDTRMSAMFSSHNTLFPWCSLSPTPPPPHPSSFSLCGNILKHPLFKGETRYAAARSIPRYYNVANTLVNLYRGTLVRAGNSIQLRVNRRFRQCSYFQSIRIALQNWCIYHIYIYSRLVFRINSVYAYIVNVLLYVIFLNNVSCFAHLKQHVICFYLLYDLLK